MEHLSIILSYYKSIQNLKLLLKALQRQSKKHFEVILSEDDNNPETVAFLKQQGYLGFEIIHLNQKDDVGFRKNQMLNRAVQAANFNKLAFIDGDCIPHPHFVLHYLKEIRDDYYCVGRAVMLSKGLTKKLLVSNDLRKLTFLSLLFSGSKKLKEGLYFPAIPNVLNTNKRGLVGRNWGILKKHLFAINGFDEDFVRPTVGEDTDVERRLQLLGLKRLPVKHRAIVYHLYHKRFYNESDRQVNENLFDEKKLQPSPVCYNGIEKLRNL